METRLDQDFPGLEAAAAAGASRRSFLRAAGFGLAALSSCSRPGSERILTWLAPPEGLIAGRAYRIATTSRACPAGCGILVKCRDGRPILVEGHPGHPLSRGGVCPSCQASLLSLYDSQRPAAPEVEAAAVTLEAADARVRELLASARTVRLLTPSLLSPSTRALAGEFLARAGDGRLVEYDALSMHALLEATERTRGLRVVPGYRLEEARVVVSVDADFLGTWLDPVGFAAARAQARSPEEGGAGQLHWQLEARMSLTGSKADRRRLLAPWERGAFLTALAWRLGGGEALGGERPRLREDLEKTLEAVARDLEAAGRHALLLCGSNRVEEQILTAWIQELLGCVGTTVDLEQPSLRHRGDDRALAALRQELEEGRVDLLIVGGGNPAYEIPGLGEVLRKAGARVVLAEERHETAGLAAVLYPLAHPLERWDDLEARPGLVSLAQPSLPPLRQGRTLRECLARWMGDTRSDRRLLEDSWRERLAPAAPPAAFRSRWRSACRRGWLEFPGRRSEPSPFRREALAAVPAGRAPRSGRLRLVLHADLRMLDGRNAHNAWLQELPDPLTHLSWEHALCLAPGRASRLGLQDGDLVRLRAGDGPAVELPVLVQPGQHEEIAAVALGFGREGTDRFTRVGPDWIQAEATVEPGGRIGVSMRDFLRLDAGGLQFEAREVEIEVLGRSRELACSQDWQRLDLPERLAPASGPVREVARRVSRASLAGAAAAEIPAETSGEAPELWPEDHPRPGHHWGVVVDLDACTGCGACVLSCQTENNIPVVGRDEMRRHREMSWMRIDRYWIGEGEDTRALHQPMFCQHCGHAPCETVCPVLATVHSREGLNQQVYNRCVGTRYCANNCPYKVRRFNWFDYPHQDHLQNLALNPDVTIRSRGVMEKCSLCVQRIHEARARAREEGRELRDGDIRLACQASCPSRAIHFGDWNDPESGISRLVARSRRSYAALEELNVRPTVRYLAAVHPDAEEEDTHGA